MWRPPPEPVSGAGGALALVVFMRVVSTLGELAFAAGTHVYGLRRGAPKGHDES